MSTPSTVYLERKGSIAELILNRPEVLNAENWPLAHDFHAALDELERAADVRAVIVSGEGRAFSSGVDVNALARGELKIDWFRSFDLAMRRLEQIDVLTVAKIRGYAIGGGLQITLACDLRVATLDARFGLPAVLEALIPGMGTYRLPRFVGLGRARRMALTGELNSADEGLQTARGFTKKLLTSSFESDYDEAFTTYLEYQEISSQSGDHKQAMAEYRASKT